MFDLTGKTALVTGSTGGIGGAIARALHGQGATVALSGTRREALDLLATELAARAHVLPCNLADKDDVETLVPRAEEAMGSLDILVNNAGITRDNIFMRFKDEDWDQVIAVDLTAGFRLARAAAVHPAGAIVRCRCCTWLMCAPRSDGPVIQRRTPAHLHAISTPSAHGLRPVAACMGSSQVVPQAGG